MSEFTPSQNSKIIFSRMTGVTLKKRSNTTSNKVVFEASKESSKTTL